MRIRSECSMVAMAWLPWRAVRVEDIVWVLLFTALALVSSRSTPYEIALVLCLGAFQVIEPRLRFFASRRGRVAAVSIKLVLCYLLIGWTGGISSSYYVVLLLPVMSAATSLEPAQSLGVMLLAGLSYLSFLLPVYIDYSRYQVTFEAFSEIGLRMIFLPVVALLTYQHAQENRETVRRYQKAERELEIAEAAVRRSERLAALGQLTAGLAHELRNPLGTIRASAEVIARRLPTDDAVGQELAGFISTEVDRTNSLISPISRLCASGASAVGGHRCHPRAGCRDRGVRTASSAAAGQRPPVVSPGRASTAGDAELLQRVFYNLILNAAQASPAGAVVTVKTRLANEDYVAVDVIDRGRGIEAANLEQVFNPFFTTRPTGVGLGLAIVSRIVDEHGGAITVESEPGAGTVFRVALPVRMPRTQTQPPPGSERLSATPAGPNRN